MNKLLEAKEIIAETYKDTEGFLGVGIGRTGGLDVVRVYVSSITSPAAKKIKKTENF